MVIKLEGEDRPFPSAAEVLQGVLGITSSESTAISGMVRTGACYHEVWTQKHQQAVRLVEILDGKTILRWRVCARRLGERLPMYVVLNAPWRVTNTDINTAMARYGVVNAVREQKYKLWPTISNGHRSVSYKKVSVPIPGQIKIKGATLTVRVYGEIEGGNRCHRCGGEGHFKADCPRQQDDGDARQTVAPPAAKATPSTATTTTTTTTTTKTMAAPVARPNEPTTGATPKQKQQQPTTTSTRPGTPYPAPSNSKSPQQSPRRERVVRRRLLPEDDPTTNATNNNNSICS